MVRKLKVKDLGQKIDCVLVPNHRGSFCVYEGKVCPHSTPTECNTLGAYLIGHPEARKAYNLDQQDSK